MSAPVLKVMGVGELGYAVAGYLVQTDDILNACLTCRDFYAAARPHLFRAIELPEISVKNPRKNTNGRRPFHKRFATELSHFTRSIRIDGYVVANKTLSSIEDKHMQWRNQDMSHVELKNQIDRLFDGIGQVLAQAPRLREFKSFDMPRSLDLMMLLQTNCPSIESIKITPSSRDGHGFAVFNPAQFAQPIMGRRPVADGCVFPLWNVVNMKIDPGIVPEFDFPNLTVLSLCNIRYPWPGHHHARSLVWILKGARNLKCLELAGYPTNNNANIVYPYIPSRLPPGFVPIPPPPLPPPPPPNWGVPPPHIPPNARHQFGLLAFICKAYEAAGYQPLKLRHLRLFRGAELINDSDSRPERSHYLAALTDLSYLEELHVDHPDYLWARPSMQIPRPVINPRSRYLWPNSIRLITDGHLPRLRKLSLPHTDGCVWKMLSELDREFAARLSVRVYFPEYESREHAYKEYTKHWESLGNFRGLVLTGWHTLGELTANLPPNLPRTRSLGIFMSPWKWMSRNEKLPRYQKVLDDYVETFPQAPEVRELWLAKAQVPFYCPADRVSRCGLCLIAPEKLEYLATSLAEKYDKLSYIRIYESAWRIHRPSPGEETDRVSGKNSSKHAVELLQILAADVGIEMPEAFDFSSPTVM